MAKKPSSKPAKVKAGASAEDHRKQASMLTARARLHHAKADLLEAKNPPKRKGGMYGSEC